MVNFELVKVTLFSRLSLLFPKTSWLCNDSEFVEAHNNKEDVLPLCQLFVFLVLLSENVPSLVLYKGQLQNACVLYEHIPVQLQIHHILSAIPK